MSNPRYFRPPSIALFLALLPSTLIAQQVGEVAKQAGKAARTHYSIAYKKAAKSWKVGSATQTSDQISQLVLDAVVSQLAKQGFVRTPALEGQCCSVVIEVLSAALSNTSGQKSQLALFARITLIDVDQQTIYTKDYEGEGTDQIASAAIDLANKAAADSQLIHGLAGS